MKRGEGIRIAIGCTMVLGLCNPFLTLPVLGLLAVLWLLQKPAPKVWTGVASAPKWVRWATATLYGHIQRNIDNSTKTVELQEASKDKLLWHVAIGSNCNKDVLEGRRNVKPRQSFPCRIEGYTLLFNHRGLPYWEPSFATIGHADEVEAAIAEETNGSSAPILRSATKAAKAALGLNGGAVEGSSGASRPHNGSGNVAADGHTNSHAAGRADGPAAGSRSSTSAIDGNGESSGNGSSVSAGGIVQRTAAVVRRSLAALGGLLLAEAPPPAVPRQYRAANGRPALHGVVHQISEADMAQIVATEGGGGNQKMGYKLEEMTCTLYNGSRVQALGFTTHPCSSTCPSLVFAHPSERYLQIVRVGIASSGIADGYQEWLKELQPYRRDTLGQLVGAYIVVAVMLSAGVVVGAALSAYRLVARRKAKSVWLHVTIQHLMGAVWWLHNRVLAHTFGRGA